MLTPEREKEIREGIKIVKDVPELKYRTLIVEDLLAEIDRLRSQNDKLRVEQKDLRHKIQINRDEWDKRWSIEVERLEEERDQLKAEKFKAECEATEHWKHKNLMFEEMKSLQEKLAIAEDVISKAKQVVSHWNEFHTQAEFEETIHWLQQALARIQGDGGGK
jgi:hypothetical protein